MIFLIDGAYIMSCILMGTGGYTDVDLIGTLYPIGTTPAQYLTYYHQHYATVEINSSFHAPVGQSAFAGMLEKTKGTITFSVKLHQDFSHTHTATQQQAQAFLTALSPLRNTGCFANLLLQFPQQFSRTQTNRLYLAQVLSWFENVPLAVEFRHPSWHIEPVFRAFTQQPNLIWCNVDYPPLCDFPKFKLFFNQRTGYLRLHGRNLNWHTAESAKQRHDYRYTDDELYAIATLIYQHKQQFDCLYLYFQNTTNSHAVYNLHQLQQYLTEYGFTVPYIAPNLQHNALKQQDLF